MTSAALYFPDLHLAFLSREDNVCRCYGTTYTQVPTDTLTSVLSEFVIDPTSQGEKETYLLGNDPLPAGSGCQALFSSSHLAQYSEEVRWGCLL